MAKRVSVAVGDSETMRSGFLAMATEPLPASIVTGKVEGAGAAAEVAEEADGLGALALFWPQPARARAPSIRPAKTFPTGLTSCPFTAGTERPALKRRITLFHEG
ncbi:hypothetical protein GCM10022248_08440 [Nonomuraea soli]